MRRDLVFLERIFQKLNLNFTWWVNQEDPQGDNAFEGGFLGLDNIGPFNRSEALPVDGVLEQSDGTGWMASYCLDQLEIALRLAAHNPIYEDLAVKYFEHFTLIADAMTQTGLWSEDDGFFYDVVRLADDTTVPMRIRSMVGLVPAVALTVIHDDEVAGLDSFLDRARWFVQHKPTASGFFGRYVEDEHRAMGLLAVVSPERLRRILGVVLDESEFLSPFGLRSLSRAHLDQPVQVDLAGFHAEVGYEPAESTSGLFGGNSNWRGPIWFPVNFLVIEKLRRFGEFVGDEITVELPTGSGHEATLGEVADELARRLIATFEADADRGGRRPVDGDPSADPGAAHHPPPAVWFDHPWFFEYFDGDTGRGLGASHQTGLDGARRRSRAEPPPSPLRRPIPAGTPVGAGRTGPIGRRRSRSVGVLEASRCARSRVLGPVAAVLRVTGGLPIGEVQRLPSSLVRNHLFAVGIDPQKLLESFGTFAFVGFLAIVFAESGIMIGFFLPGDSLLFVAGFLAYLGTTPDGPFIMPNIALVSLGAFIAAVAGDQVGYMFGKRVGPAPVPPSRLATLQAEVPALGRGLLRTARVEDDHHRPLRPHRPDVRPDRGRCRQHEVPHLRHLQRHRWVRVGHRPHAGRLLAGQDLPGPRREHRQGDHRDRRGLAAPDRHRVPAPPASGREGRDRHHRGARPAVHGQLGSVLRRPLRVDRDREAAT